MSDINNIKQHNKLKIIVYGLGIIGGSLSASLKRAGHSVYGMNRGRAALDYALAHGYIDGEAHSFDCADVVFLALPPRVAIRVLREGEFPQGCVVSDICGVKQPVEDAVFEKPRKYRYVGAHPMAGKETTGVTSASATLFDGKNLVLTKCAHTDEAAFALIQNLGKEMGFGRIVTSTAREHDRIIALTSQLAHVVSNAYIKSPLAGGCGGFTGGSFQDMTRVAPLDEAVWAELFFMNKENLSAEIGRLIGELRRYLDALEGGDEEGMRALLAEGKAAFYEFSEKNSDIIVQKT